MAQNGMPKLEMKATEAGPLLRSGVALHTFRLIDVPGVQRPLAEKSRVQRRTSISHVRGQGILRYVKLEFSLPKFNLPLCIRKTVLWGLFKFFVKVQVVSHSGVNSLRIRTRVSGVK